MAALQTKGPARAHAGEGCSKGTEGVSSRPGSFEFFAVVEICSVEMLVEIRLPACLFPQEQINMAQKTAARQFSLGSRPRLAGSQSVVRVGLSGGMC